MRPARQKTRFRRCSPVPRRNNPGNVHILAAKVRNKSIARGIIAHRSHRQNTRPQFNQIAHRIRAAARNDSRLFMPQNNHRRLARDTRNLSRDVLVHHKIADHRDGLLRKKRNQVEQTRQIRSHSRYFRWFSTFHLSRFSESNPPLPPDSPPQNPADAATSRGSTHTLRAHNRKAPESSCSPPPAPFRYPHSGRSPAPIPAAPNCVPAPRAPAFPEAACGTRNYPCECAGNNKSRSRARRPRQVPLSSFRESRQRATRGKIRAPLPIDWSPQSPAVPPRSNAESPPPRTEKPKIGSDDSRNPSLRKLCRRGRGKPLAA